MEQENHPVQNGSGLAQTGRSRVQQTFPTLQSIQPARKHLLESLLRLLLDCEVLWLHRHRLGRNSSVVGVDQLLLINDGGLDLALRLDGPRSDPQVASITAPTSYRVGSLGQMISDPNDPLV